MDIELRVPHNDPAALRLARSGFAQLGYRQKLTARQNGLWLDVEVPNKRPALDAALGVLQGVSRLQLSRIARKGIVVPDVYSSGVKYVREPDGREYWQTASDTYFLLEGDCEDLANTHAAWLNVYANEPARARTVKTGPRMYHAIVERADGSIDDPSAALGMLKRERRCRGLKCR